MSKVALVTGASRGLGRSVCEIMTRRGYTIIGMASHPANAQITWVDAYICIDLHSDSIERALPPDIEFDVLVNAAAIYLDDPRRGHAGITALTRRELQTTFGVNLFAAVELALLLLPGMRRKGYGRIVNVSSGMGRMQEFDSQAFAYRASKLSLNAATLSLAHAIDSTHDISVFSFCPGWIRTDMGTSDAPNMPDGPAQDILELIELPAHETSGLFFRGRQKLDWWARKKGIT